MSGRSAFILAATLCATAACSSTSQPSSWGNVGTGAGDSSASSSGSGAGADAEPSSGSGSGTASGSGVASGSGSGSGSAAASGSGSGSGSSSGAGPGSGSGSGGRDAGSARQVFSPCRFHFGTLDSNAKSGGASLISQLDMFTSGWIGGSANFNLNSVCTDTNPGGALAGKVPALVAYVIAFTGRNAPGYCLADCNANNAGCIPASDLCTKGAAYIRASMGTLANPGPILARYKTFAQGFAQSCGTTRPIIWEMEPDYYQYTQGQGGNPLTLQEAATYMSLMIQMVNQYLPNAVFSMDTSPWMPKDGAAWYPAFDMTQFTFVNTSGGGTLANSLNIRNGQDTWAGIHVNSGKPILADTGYGAAGTSGGPDPAWDLAANVNARIADGVISVTQYHPAVNTWGATLAAVRPQLNATSCY